MLHITFLEIDYMIYHIQSIHIIFVNRVFILIKNLDNNEKRTNEYKMLILFLIALSIFETFTFASEY